MPLGDLSDDDLLGALTSWAGRVAAGEAELLRLLGELDARGTWATWGALSCAHWAAWRLGLSPGTARERVRVARRLRELPVLSAAMATGAVSFAQVRAITRATTTDDEAAWLDLARSTTAAQLEKAVRGVLRARPTPDGDVPPPAPPSLRSRYDDDGYLTVVLRFSPDQAVLVMPALQSAQRAEQADRDALYARLTAQLAALPDGAALPEGAAPSDGPARPRDHGVPAGTSAGPAAPPVAEPYEYEEPPYPVLTPRIGLFDVRSARDAAALAAWTAERDRRRVLRDASRAWSVHVSQQAAAARLPAPHATDLDGALRLLTRPTGLPPVTVQLQVDPSSGWARTPDEELLPPTTVQGVLRTAPVTAGPLDRGRRSRLVTPALRALLQGVDGQRCRFPGCTRSRGLDAHHVRFWRHGGRTDLANLVLLCERHHTLVHEQGFQLALTPDRALTVRTRDDIPVPHHPPLPTGDSDWLPLDAALADETSHDRFDLRHVVSVMLQHTS